MSIQGNNEKLQLTRHFIIILLFGFMSAVSYMMFSNHYDFRFFSIIFSWILLLVLGLNIKWFDDKMDTYFRFCILFTLAARMSRYNVPDISKGISYFAFLLSSGLLVNSIAKMHIKSSLLLIGILTLEYTNLSDIYG